MKFINKILLTVGVAALLSTSARADVGSDVYQGFRTVTVGTGVTLNPTTWPNGYTNTGVIDRSIFNGVATINITAITNVPGGTLTVTPQFSSDTTNWTTISNFSVATAQSIVYTNFSYGGTNLFGTNTYNLGGTVTIPSAATAGWVTPYITSSLFTNNAAVTVPVTGVPLTLGVPIDDVPGRYLRFTFATGGTVTNICVGAPIITTQTQYPY